MPFTPDEEAQIRSMLVEFKLRAVQIALDHTRFEQEHDEIWDKLLEVDRTISGSDGGNGLRGRLIKLEGKVTQVSVIVASVLTVVGNVLIFLLRALIGI
jgi:hypothetical protein